MNRNLIIFLVLFTLSIVVNIYFELPTEILNFCLAITLLFVELLDYNRYRNKLQSDKLIFIKSNEWMGAFPLVGFMIYWFSDEPMNIWNIAAITGVVVYGVLEVVQNYRTVYEYGDNGIRNLRTNKLKSAEHIKAVDFNKEQLAIHTSKYQNDLVILAKNLQSPTWDELTSELSKLAKNEG